MKFMHKECLVALLFAQAALHADSAMINIDARSTTNLNGHWQIIIDPYNAGFYNYHQVPYEKNGYFANAKPSHKSDRIEYDFTPDNVLDVPGDWNTQRDPLYYYEGAVWYKKDFEVGK